MIRYWIEMHFAGVPGAFVTAVGMALRGTLKRNLVSAIIVSYKADLNIPGTTLEAHTLAGGRPDEVIKAAIQLNKMDQPVDCQLLCAIDLSTGNLQELIDAYGHVREAHPDFEFEEFIRRHQQGEDVIRGSLSGSLAPISISSGWRLRIEYGPLTAQGLNELLSKLKTDARVMVMRPDGDVWEPASRVRDLVVR
jgi:hypothetical protein